MSVNLHLLGGSGRIGQALVENLVTFPSNDVVSINIYCDSTKVADVNSRFCNSILPRVIASGYSAFNTIDCRQQVDKEESNNDRHVVLNLRGINYKQQWLNQPLDSLDLHVKSCRTIVDADLWMQPGFEVIHFGSLLCDLIEGSRSLDDICEGQESYRRPYMVSRLHQEMILSANAYQNSISTSLLRMPAVYGFDDDYLSPWVLNSLCKSKLCGQTLSPRHPDRIVYLTHRDPLIAWIRLLILQPDILAKNRTVKYLRPPMLCLSVQTLSNLVDGSPTSLTIDNLEDLPIKLEGDIISTQDSIETHLSLLTSSISELLSND